MPVLQQFDGNAIGRAHECHMAIAGRAIDGDAIVHEPLASLVDIFDAIGEVTEIAAAAVGLCSAAIFRRPVVSQLDLRILVPRCGNEDQGEAALLIIEAAYFLEPEHLEEAQGGVDVFHADHGVEIFGHWCGLLGLSLVSNGSSLGWQSYSSQIGFPRWREKRGCGRWAGCRT